MKTAWERLEGCVPVNGSAAALMKRLRDQEVDGESTIKAIDRLEHEKLELEQEVTYYLTVSMPGLIKIIKHLLEVIESSNANVTGLAPSQEVEK